MQIIKIFLQSLFIFLVVLLVMILVQACFALIGFSLTQDPSSSIQLLIEGISPVIAAFLLLVWGREYKSKLYNTLINALKIEQNTFRLVTITILVVLVILYLLFGLSGLLNLTKFIHFGNVEYSTTTIIKQTLLVGILGNIFIAIGEEIIFRGFLLNYIYDISKSKLFALLFTAIVFSLHPYHDLLNYVIAFLAGLILGYSYFKFKTLYVPMVIHFAYNIFNFSIASHPGHGPQLPYLIKFDYSMIKNGLGAWVDLFIIAGFVIIFLFLLYMPSTGSLKDLNFRANINNEILKS